jgi:hypothetical protein
MVAVKARPENEDWLRPEYTRADLGKIVRGKYADSFEEKPNQLIQQEPPAFRIHAFVNGLQPGLDPDKMNQLLDEIETGEAEEKARQQPG